VPGPTTLAFLGDLMLGRRVSESLRTKPPEWIWGDVLPLLRGADAVIANLESPITAHRKPWRATWKTFHFRADPAAVEMLHSANIRLVSLANNHILDFNAEGLFETIRHLDAAGIAYAGAGRDSAAAAAPAVLRLPALRIGVLAATDTMRSFRGGPSAPGTNYIAIERDSPALEWIAESAAALRREGAAPIVLSLHWGPNMRLQPRARFRAFARAAIERGVDIVHGHSAHVFQAVEAHRGGVILYDTGNFIDDHWNFWNFGTYWNFPFRHDDWSFVFLVDLEAGRPRRLRMIPVQTRPWPLRRATGATFEAIARRMDRLSAALGGPIARTPEGLAIEITAPRDHA
jgi:poly-gamma-glutamate capsule biosynthesis protein CapA/YwtB (metallophosphatase superfamily)